MMKRWINDHFLYIPLFLVEAYLGFTVLLYQFGPLNWKTENEVMFWILLLLYHTAFCAGYVVSINRIKVSKGNDLISESNPRIFQGFMWGVILSCIVCACIEYRNLTQASSYIPYKLPKEFLSGLINPAKQYYGKFASEGYDSNKLVTVISSLFSFAYISIIPLLLVEWNRITRAQKVCCFAIILFRVMVYISIGTNKGIFDTMFGFVGMLLVLLLLNYYRGNDKAIRKKTLCAVSVFTLFLAVFSFSYFSFNISSRVGSPVEYALEVSGNSKGLEETSGSSQGLEETSGSSQGLEETSGSGQGLEETSGSSQGLEEASGNSQELEEAKYINGADKPDSFLKKMYYSISNYVTQGYYGMSLSIDEEFTSTYGIGNSTFLTSNFESIFGIEVKDKTYQHKITEIWDEDEKWHSFYSYIANDVSFYGVVIIMFLIGLFYGCICKDVIVNDSLIGKLLLPLFIQMFLYMPANNQVFTNMATCTAFIELAAIWGLSKKLHRFV